MCADVSVARRIPTQTRVLGVTSVGDELFVLLVQEPIAVYSITDYRKLRNFNVPGYKSHDENDMTSCVQLQRLYISDFHNSAVHSYQLGTTLKRLARFHVKKWDVGGSPLGLSVTPTCHLLVVCGGYSEHKKLVELKAETGELVREIALHRYMRNPHHGVRLTTGELVVCHGGSTSARSRVCVVDDDGNIMRSFGGEELYKPCHLAVDEHSGDVFVACYGNDSILLLSPTLGFTHHVIGKMKQAKRLYFHQETQRLFVVEDWGHQVNVIQL